jgi:hypothetical protein
LRVLMRSSSSVHGGRVDRGLRWATSSSASSGRPRRHSTSQAASSKALVVPCPNETPASVRRALRLDQFDDGHASKRSSVRR